MEASGVADDGEERYLKLLQVPLLPIGRLATRVGVDSITQGYDCRCGFSGLHFLESGM